MSTLGIALTLARRELRSGVRGLGIVLACLALGVAAIAAVGSLRAGVEAGLAQDGRRLLGGDVAVATGAEAPPAALLDWLHGRGGRTSAVVQMRSMLVAGSGERQLVELKVVDGAYPLVGSAITASGQPVQAALRERGVVAEPLVLQRLGVADGAALRLGSTAVAVRGALAEEPDRIGGRTLLAPRAMIGAASLAATELVQPGSLLSYELRAVFPAGTDARATAEALRAAFPNQGYRVRTAGEAAPGIERFIERVGLFLTLVGLSALLVGGIGVATGVRAWLEARARSIATLRCLGAPTPVVFTTYLIQVGVLCLAGVLIGVVAGAALTAGAITVFGSAIPLPAKAGIYPAPLLLASAYGVLVAGAFALWPLARAAQIPGAALFRDAIVARGVRGMGRVAAANAAVAAVLVGLLVYASPDRWFAAWFCLVAAATLVLFRVGGSALTEAARRARALPSAWARLGVANLHRPGSGTALLMVAVGLGLSTLSAVALIQGNIRAQVLEQIPEQAPTFFFIDIQNDQVERFDGILAAQTGVEEIKSVPSLRARIVSVDGVPANEVKATPETQWALRGDRGLTYSAAPPDGTRVVEGAWWPTDYAGPPLVSFDANLARGWGVSVGDVIRVNVLGRDIDLKIANLREIDWRSLGINFTMVASPGLLERAPHTRIATVRTTGAAEAPVLRAVTDALPNVSGIRVADVLGTVADLVNKLAATLAATGAVTLVAGVLVLMGAVAAGQRRRIADAVVLKAVGATRGQIRAAWLVEFGLIGLAAGLLAAAVGTAASWGVVRFVMRADWVFLPGTLAAVVVGCTALMLAFGYLGTAAALRVRVAPLLRNE